MPYESVWRDPEVVLTYKGFRVYFTYRDDDYDQGESKFMYVTDPEEGPDDAFDVRELPTWKEPPHPPYLTGDADTPENRALWDEWHKDRVEEKAIMAALKEAIDLGLIPPRVLKEPK